MGKPKEYVGETWSNPWDDRGKDYRWDKKKKKYVESFGASPAASLSRSLGNLSDSLIGSDEEESTLGSLQTILDNSALIYRTFKNNNKLEETEDVTIEQVAKDFNQYNDLNPFVDFIGEEDDASQNFIKQLQNLDPKDPKHNLVAKMVATNKLNSRRDEEQTHFAQSKFKQQVAEVNKPIEDPAKAAEELKSPIHSYDGPGSADFEAEKEFRTGEKPKTQHKIETWRDLEDEQLPAPEADKPPEKVETPVEGLTETVIESGTNSTANKLQDILNNRKPLTSLFGNMR